MPFRTFGLDAKILKAVQETGYTQPTPIQSAAIPPVLSGIDVIGIAQTGTGKTAAFVLPILNKLVSSNGKPGPRHVRALVVAPTRELAAQIEENVRAYAKHLPLRATSIFGGVGEGRQIQALRSGIDLLVATPGRLLDLVNRRLCDLSQLNCLVLDEADRMLDMGFLPDIRRIIKALPAKRQTLLFSATLSPEIETISREFLRAPKTIQIGRRANPAETVTQCVHEVPKHLKSALLAHLLRGPEMEMVLVFSRMKHGADKIARFLESKGIPTATLHSNRSQNQRLRALNDFKSGAVRVLVATDIAARGIDVDGISHVVNYDFPMHSEDYVHRIGRTGRAQAAGQAISFVTAEDYGNLRSLERFIGKTIPRKRVEGFDTAAPAPAAAPRSQPNNQRQRQGSNNASTQNPGPRGKRPNGNRQGQRRFRSSRNSRRFQNR